MSKGLVIFLCIKNVDGDDAEQMHINVVNQWTLNSSTQN